MEKYFLSLRVRETKRKNLQPHYVQAPYSAKSQRHLKLTKLKEDYLQKLFLIRELVNTLTYKGLLLINMGQLEWSYFNDAKNKRKKSI